MKIDIKLNPKEEIAHINEKIILNRVTENIETSIEVSEDDVESIINIHTLLTSNKITIEDKEQLKYIDSVFKKIKKKHEDKIKPDNKKSIIVGLPKGKLIWQSNDGEIQLNAFSKNVSLELKPSELKPSTLQDIQIALEYGTLILLDGKVNEEDIQINTIDIEKDFEENSSLQESLARFILDQPMTEFKKFFDKTVKAEQIKFFLIVEKKHNNRKDYIEFLNTQLSTLGITV
jgi:hypothetical protein